MDQLIARMDRWLAANRPDYGALLQPGVSDADLDAFESRFAIKLKTMMSRATAILAPVAVLMLSAAANAELPQSSEQPGARSDDATIDAVTVEAERRKQRLEDQLSEFTFAITKSDPDESVARWQLPICLMVAGLPLEQGRFVFQRISRVATEVGVSVGPPDCIPNLVIVMSREPEAFLKSWWNKNPQLFNRDRGLGEIRRTIQTPAPVRIFYNACSVPSELADGFAVSVTALCGEPGVPGSRLRRATVRALYSVIIVVDKRQTEGMELGPLTDYIAMNALSQIRRNPDVGGPTPTILRLFDDSDASRPQALSTWDRAFLKSLYDTDPSRVTQLAEIRHRMKRELTQ